MGGGIAQVDTNRKTVQMSWFSTSWDWEIHLSEKGRCCLPGRCEKHLRTRWHNR